MKAPCNRLEDPSKLLNFSYQFPFMAHYSLAFLFPNHFGSYLDNLDQGPIRKGIAQAARKNQFESQPKKNIVLNQNKAKKIETFKLPKIGLLDQQTTKPQKKSRQKQTRNISSNLLRIFFKNLIQLKTYGKKVDRISSQVGVAFSREQFYSWVEGFGINFKNYIRMSQVSRILKRDHPFHFRKAFMILLQQYSRQCGLLHCLTSKRIERNSLKMHLQGLKSLCKSLRSKYQLHY